MRTIPWLQVVILYLSLSCSAQAQVSTEFGAAVVRIWDVDGDGLDDWIVSDPGADSGKGKLYVLQALSGGGMKPVQQAYGSFSNDDPNVFRIGEALKVACDSDGDGFFEILVAGEFREGQATYPTTFWFNCRTRKVENATILPREFFADIWAQLPGSCGELADKSGIQPAGPPTNGGTQSWIDSKVEWLAPRAEQGFLAYQVLRTNTSWGTATNVATAMLDTRAAYAWASSAYEDAGTQNAARHCYWQALLTRDFGASVAEYIGNVHEWPRYSSGATDTWIERYNNLAGRQLGQIGWISDERLKSQIDQMIEDGTLIIDSCDDSRIPTELRDCDGDGKPDCPPEPEPDPVKRADVDRDGRVDFDDVQIVADDADNPDEPTDDPSLDQDGDCGITADDVVIVIEHVGEYVEP